MRLWGGRIPPRVRTSAWQAPVLPCMRVRAHHVGSTHTARSGAKKTGRGALHHCVSRPATAARWVHLAVPAPGRQQPVRARARVSVRGRRPYPASRICSLHARAHARAHHLHTSGVRTPLCHQSTPQRGRAHAAPSRQMPRRSGTARRGGDDTACLRTLANALRSMWRVGTVMRTRLPSLEGTGSPRDSGIATNHKSGQKKIRTHEVSRQRCAGWLRSSSTLCTGRAPAPAACGSQRPGWPRRPHGLASGR